MTKKKNAWATLEAIWQDLNEQYDRICFQIDKREGELAKLRERRETIDSAMGSIAAAQADLEVLK